MSGRITMTMSLALAATPLAAQWLNYPTAGVPRLPNGQPNLAAPAPRDAAGKPDFSGLWEPEKGAPNAFVTGGTPLAPEFGNIAAKRKEPLPYRAWALELRNARQADNGKDNPDGLCLPLGMVRMHSHPFPRKVLQVPGLIAILYEKNVDYRQIFTDGRPLPADPNPSFNGYSTGKWEGETLVVETRNLNGKNPFQGSSEHMRLIERFTRVAEDTILYRFTVEDPSTWTRPWSAEVPWAKTIGPLFEHACHEGNYGLANILAGARVEEKRAADAAAKSTSR